MVSNWLLRKLHTKPNAPIWPMSTPRKFWQSKRLALEQWLAASDQSHYRALTDEKTKQARLRDRLATADLRLSVQLDAAATGCNAVQATPSTGGVVYGAHRAQLDPAHAQQIIGITGDGDQGLIALQACQAYAQKSSSFK